MCHAALAAGVRFFHPILPANRYKASTGLPKEPQVPPLRFAPVGMTILLSRKGFSEKYFRSATKLSSRPERTRISYFALLATSTYAVLRRESRMLILSATGLDRKSGGA
jgi:hypothetical protein